MICKISCSVGELIDKISILKIKLKKSESDEIRENIIRELNCLTSENPISETCDDLFLELSEINNKLWILEDNIRIKSQNKDYDREYIEMSESLKKC